MRLFWHYTKTGLLLCLAVAAYAAAVGSVLWYWSLLTPPVAVPLIGAGVAVVTSLIALLKDTVAEIIRRPQLRIRFLPYDRRDCHQTAFRNNQTGAMVAKTHYFRVRVENIGWRTAEDVEVTLEGVERFHDGQFVVDTDFMPGRLFWSYWREKRYEIPIPMGAFRYCDLAFVLDPASQSGQIPPTENSPVPFQFDVVWVPNTGRTSLLPGRYRIVLSAFGKDVRRASLTIDLEWKGLWHDSIDELLGDSLLLRKGFQPAGRHACSYIGT